MVHVPFFRSVALQIVLVGLVSFTQPGIWNALQNLGAGGEEKPYLVNAANSLTYGLMVFGCTLGGSLCNWIGAKWTLTIGVIFYTPYASSLYVNNRYGNEWYVMLGAALCGVGASLFWASEATIAVGYPTEAQRGRMVAIWMGLRNLGPLIGGAISLSLNVKGAATKTAGKVSYETYLVLIGIQCAGLPLALLLSPPDKVKRPDGTKILYMKRKSTLKSELKKIWAIVRSREIALLMPIFITGIWGNTYQSNYLTKYFSVRSRALISLLTAIMNIIADLIVGTVTDSKLLGNQSSRAKVLWIAFAVLTTAQWIWQTVTQVHFTRNSHTVDWADGSRFANAISVFLLAKLLYEAQIVFLYWLIGTYPRTEGSLERSVGILRSFESVGSCLSYGVGASHWPNLNQGILAFALWLVTIIPTTRAIWLVPEHVIEHESASSSAEDDDEAANKSRSGSESVEEEEKATGNTSDLVTSPELAKSS